MKKHAVEWAIAKGLCQTSPVHGEKEYKIPHKKTFAHTESDMHQTTVSASAQLEAICLFNAYVG